MTNYNNCPCSADRAFFEHSVSADSGLSLACICPPDIKALRSISKAKTPIELHAAVNELNAALGDPPVDRPGWMATEPTTAPVFNFDALGPQPLQFPPAIRTADDEARAQEWAAEQAEAKAAAQHEQTAAPELCPCGKHADDAYAHGARNDELEPFTCEEVLAIQARFEFSLLTPWQRFLARLRGQEPKGWRVSVAEVAANRRRLAVRAEAGRAAVRAQKEAEATA
jgi:hypothetical protein